MRSELERDGGTRNRCEKLSRKKATRVESSAKMKRAPVFLTGSSREDEEQLLLVIH